MPRPFEGTSVVFSIPGVIDGKSVTDSEGSRARAQPQRSRSDLVDGSEPADQRQSVGDLLRIPGDRFLAIVTGEASSAGALSRTVQARMSQHRAPVDHPAAARIADGDRDH